MGSRLTRDFPKFLDLAVSPLHNVYPIFIYFPLFFIQFKYDNGLFVMTSSGYITVMSIIYPLLSRSGPPSSRGCDQASSSLMLALDILVLVTAIAAFFAIRDYQRRRGLPYPPGPRPLPLIGNLLDIPRGSSWPAYISQLSKKHGTTCFTC